MEEDTMSPTLITAIILQYVVIGIVSAVEGKWIMVLYWIGAVILNIAVLLMQKG
jgi:hypothetical protein